jgi:hypothetical protein
MLRLRARSRRLLRPILPDSLKWFSPPNNALLKGAWVLGAEKDVGTYAFRVMLAKGGKIPVHTHPDTRYAIPCKVRISNVGGHIAGN